MNVASTVLADYYGILGVSQKATSEEIKSAYRKLAKTWHPDVCKRSDAHKRFIEISEAYEILSNANARREYDQIRNRTSSSNQYSAAASTNFDSYQKNAQAKAETYSTMTLEDVLINIIGTVITAGVTFIAGERPQEKVPIEYYLSSGIKLFGAIIMVLITMSGIGAALGIPAFLMISHSLYNDDRFMGIGNLIKAFFFVTVPIIIILIVMLLQLTM